ncbi:MAG: hypothetical protein V4507_10430 [Verrucomicrobiota bacterium]
MSLLRVNVDGVKPGATLGENVHSGNGILLAKKDQLIDLRLLQILKSFGVVDIVIIPEDEVSKVEGSSALSPDALEQLRQRFKNLDLKMPAIQSLFDFCALRRSKLTQGRVPIGKVMV